LTALTEREVEALQEFARSNGRFWKSHLRHAWETGNYRSYDAQALQSLRNTRSAKWLLKFKLTNEREPMTTTTITSWQDKALASTRGTKFGAILRVALGQTTGFTRFVGKASITSDGFVMCDFVDKDGEGHHGAFVGEVSDLDRNVEGLAKHLTLNSDDHNALTAAVANWIGKDWRK
jgi:hypothetical protein